MLTTFVQALPTILVAALVLVPVGVIVYRGYRNYRTGRHTCACGGSCSGCPGSCLCHPSKE